MKINIKNLKNGFFDFAFNTTREALDLEEDKTFIDKIEVKSIVEKRDNNIFVKTYVKSVGNFVCDRCLATFKRILEDEFKLIYTSDREAYGFADENVVLIYPHTQEIDLKYGVRDSLLLAKPMKVLCSEECRGLCPTCGINLNEETCHCVRKPLDSRWEQLKKLLD